MGDRSKFFALEIAAMLPAETAEALQALETAKQLVLWRDSQEPLVRPALCLPSSVCPGRCLAGTKPS